MINEIEQLAYQVKTGHSDAETYSLLSNYYERAYRVLNAYFDANREDQARATVQFNRLSEVAKELQGMDLKKANPSASDEDIQKLQSTLDRLQK